MTKDLDVNKANRHLRVNELLVKYYYSRKAELLQVKESLVILKTNRARRFDDFFEMTEENIASLKKVESMYQMAKQKMLNEKENIIAELKRKKEEGKAMPVRVQVHLRPNIDATILLDKTEEARSEEENLFDVIFQVKDKNDLGAFNLSLSWLSNESRWETKLNEQRPICHDNKIFSEDFIAFKERYYASWSDLMKINNFTSDIEYEYLN